MPRCSVTQSASQADSHERLQIGRARADVDSARKELELASRSLGQAASAEAIRIVESASSALCSACEALALQPPQRR
jgi:hypothetical protein